MDIISAILILFLVMDPMGNIPCFLSILKDVEPKRRKFIVIRELFVALVVLVFFMFAGQYFLKLLRVTQSSLSIAGGIILFLIAIKLIFYGSARIFENDTVGEPLVVPLAIPLIAGPSAIAMVILFMAHNPEKWLQWLTALICAWAISGAILIFSEIIGRVLGNRILAAVERLTGMLLAVVSVEMFVSAVRNTFINN